MVYSLVVRSVPCAFTVLRASLPATTRTMWVESSGLSAARIKPSRSDRELRR
jgi:hypothetical protein